MLVLLIVLSMARGEPQTIARPMPTMEACAAAARAVPAEVATMPLVTGYATGCVVPHLAYKGARTA